jgi:Zn-dependent membrane protease YugP
MAYYGFYFITIVLSIVGFYVSNRLKSKFRKYGNIPVRSGLSGAEIAKNMLSHYGIEDVKIVMGQGTLTDHYNPATKTVSLSQQVFEGRSIAAAAVAAHECGHAVQHVNAYSMLQLRSGIVPVVQIAARLQQIFLLIAFVLLNQFPQVMLFTIALFMITTFFSLVTLPVEFDASRRALVWLDKSGITRETEQEGAKDALKWAAMTYVAAALSSLVMLVYLVLNYMGRR